MRLTAFTHVLLAGILFASMVGLYGAWYAHVDRITAEAATIRKDIAEIKQGNKAAADAARMLTDLAGTEDTIRQHFISPADVVPFLESLGKDGARLGSAVEVVSVSESNTARTGSISISLKITGSFDSVMRTLGTIEYSPYDLAFEKVTLDATSSEGATTWAANVTMVVGTAAPTS